jgi:parallel beta-helix repeat protein
MFVSGTRLCFSDNRLKVVLFALLIGFSTILNVQSQNYVLVGDTLNSDRTWVKDTIYVVVKDLYVPLGISLVIEPGVTVQIIQGIGIFIDQGSLNASGIANDVVDSVHFVPNYSLPEDDWKWKGIIFSDVTLENDNLLEYVTIENTEIGIEIDNSEHVVIKNSTILYNQWRGIKLFNSDNCLIKDCVITEGYLGIEMYTSGLGKTTSYNLVNNCLISLQSTGMLLWSRNRGLNTYNLVSNSLFLNNDNGIQTDNGISVYGKNFIEKNILKNINAHSGYAIQIGQDSTELKNNIIWRNQTGIELRDAQECTLAENSFYENNIALTIGQNSRSLVFLNNTLTENYSKSLRFLESEDINYSNNNHFDPYIIEKSVYNGTANTVTISNNYWGTTDTSDIDRMLEDKYDNQLLGELIYQPFFTEPETNCPVSPPMNVFKQLVGDSIKVSWSANKERDIQAYRVYFGDFKNYAFPNYLEANDTVAFLKDYLITDSIAVTALDDTLFSEKNQLNGHESPYAFASIAPFAGDDFTMCENEIKVKLNSATAPFDYNELTWTTSGDGVFDEMTLNPTYTPGIIDFQLNQVILTILVKHNNTILKDSLKVLFADFPLVELGNDTSIYNDTPLKLINASASGFNTIQWHSTGDGVFNDSSVLQPVYIPGINDINAEQVNLFLIADSDCGMTSDTMTVYLNPFASIEGKIWSDGQGFGKVAILAFKSGVETIKPVQITWPDNDGRFKFERLLFGDYLIFAVPDTSFPDNIVSSYYIGSAAWQQSYTIKLIKNVYDIDIQILKTDYQLPEGKGKITGHFIKPALSAPESEIYCSAWFETDVSDYCENGLSNTTILLYNQSHDKILAYTLTDAQGDFIFDGLPFGSYKIAAEIPSYTSSVSPLIQLSPENTSANEITLAIEDQKVSIYFPDEKQEMHTMLLPNPASEKINIRITNQADGALSSIEIFNSMGQTVYKKSGPFSSDNSDYISINIIDWAEGLYIVRLHNGLNSLSYPFVKD